MHAFLYQFKIMIRDKTLLFWTMLFPLILATFFSLAFSNLTSGETFDSAKVAIVKKQEDQPFIQLMEQLSKTEKPLVKITYLSESKAKKQLKENEIDAMITIQDTIEVTVNKTGIKQAIVETIVNHYYQSISTMEHIYELKPEILTSGILNEVYQSQDNFKERSMNHTDVTVIYFYTLIGMTCMYGGFWGLRVTTMVEANLSRQGTRINMVPLSKYKVLFSGMASAFIFQYATMLLLLCYLVFGLHVEFGSQVGYIALLMAIGSLAGISMGNLIGNGLRKEENTKISIVTMISMLMSFLSGMMIIDIKYYLTTYFPFTTYINPVSLITDALYALYYYSTYDRYFLNLMYLSIITIILFVLSFFAMRKKRYDSI